jgi:hypothetical protein
LVLRGYREAVKGFLATYNTDGWNAVEKVDFQKVQIDRSVRAKGRNIINRTGMEQRENGMQILNKASFLRRFSRRCGCHIDMLHSALKSENFNVTKTGDL